MALKTLMLRKRIDLKKKELESTRACLKDVEKREEELAVSIDEVTNEEEQAAVQESVDSLIDEKEKLLETVDELDKVIKDLEDQLAEEEAAQNTEPSAAEVTVEETNERSKPAMNHMETRQASRSMSYRERLAQLVTRDDVKTFLNNTRTCIKEKRAVNNVGLTIPVVLVELLRANIENYSKLYRHVRMRPVNGTARQNIMDEFTEAIWVECCGTLNEMDLGFHDVEADCFMVGGYYAICNAAVEDSDLDLAAEIMVALGQGIGMAIDKAILYGRNGSSTQKMPLGVVTRLMQTEKPSGYPATARPWQDLHQTHVISIPATSSGLSLFQALVRACGKTKGKYSRGERVHVMNEHTYTELKAQAMAFTAGGAIVTAMEGSMPVVGGIVEVLEFMPDNVIVSGYFDLYGLFERAGQQFATSEHVRFIQNQTVFRGLARYDGQPLIPEGFVVIGLDGVTPTADMLFAPDTANLLEMNPPTVEALDPATDLWGTLVSAIQSDVLVSGNAIYGTLKYLSSGALANDWGPGYFLALNYANIDSRAVQVMVGLTPTAGAGFQALDSDHASVMKITNKDAQVFKVITYGPAGEAASETYSLAGLTLQPQQ